jgi:PD-(D/E)XK endonuclease
MGASGKQCPRSRCRSAPGRIRTCDFRLRRTALYPLSYGRWQPRLVHSEVTATRTRVRPVRPVPSNPWTRSPGVMRPKQPCFKPSSKRRIGVLVPFGSGQPFDLAAVMPGGDILRVQVKSGRVRNGCVMFNTASTDHGRGRLDYRGRADVLAVHVASISRVFMVPVDECPGYVCALRLDPPRNNQRRGVRLAEDYAFGRWLESQSSPGLAA